MRSANRGGRAALPAGKIGAKGRKIPKGGPPPGSGFGAAPAKRSAGLGPRGPQGGVSTSGTRGEAAQGPAPTKFLLPAGAGLPRPLRHLAWA